MLNSVDAVIDALGGPTAAGDLLGVWPSAVVNWRTRGKITADKFLLVTDALKAKGLKVSPGVFGFKAEARA